jgi:hypothetical protein
MENLNKIEAIANLLAIVHAFQIKEIGLFKCKESVDEAYNRLETMHNLGLVSTVLQSRFNALCFLVFTQNNNIEVSQN